MRLALILVSCVTLLRAAGNWMLEPFKRPTGLHPVISPNKELVFNCPIRKEPVHWEALHTFNPAAVVRNGRIYVLFRAEDDTGEMMIGGHTSRLGLAESPDGLHFTQLPAPVLYPDEDDQKMREWPGGCEDPRLVETDDGTYVVTYTQWNQKTTDAAIATSRDLITWEKHGPIFGKVGGAYATLSYKSAGIVCRKAGDRLLATKINGKYWMFWGEGTVRLATSDNLIDWTPLEEDGKPVVALAARPGRFDSGFPEVGPPPVLTNEGILVLYNGKNDPANGDRNIGPNAYAAGQALFDARDPRKLISRLDEPFFAPRAPFEKSGQYAAGTTFVEALVRFHRAWFLYYGTADSYVGVAVCRC